MTGKAEPATCTSETSGAITVAGSEAAEDHGQRIQRAAGAGNEGGWLPGDAHGADAVARGLGEGDGGDVVAVEHQSVEVSDPVRLDDLHAEPELRGPEPLDGGGIGGGPGHQLVEPEA